MRHSEGLGTRISEGSCLRPMPMIEIGGKPVIFHIVKIYSALGKPDSLKNVLIPSLHARLRVKKLRESGIVGR